jgi:hypothetical protein
MLMDYLDFRDLIVLMKTCGKILVKELPLHTSAVNMTRRMLKIVRDEYAAACHAVSNYYEYYFILFEVENTHNYTFRRKIYWIFKNLCKKLLPQRKMTMITVNW